MMNHLAAKLPIHFLASSENGSSKLELFMHRWNSEQQNVWFTMYPEKRYFRATSTTAVAIHTNFFTDFYALIGTSRTGWYTTLMKLPFLFLIWIGFLLASFGGLRSVLRLLKKDKLRWN